MNAMNRVPVLMLLFGFLLDIPTLINSNSTCLNQIIKKIIEHLFKSDYQKGL